MSFFGIPKGFLGWDSGGSAAPPPPYIIASTALITGMNYNAGSGPSAASVSFNISALGLTPAAGNITVTPPSAYEISSNNGAAWQSTPILIAYTGGAVTTPTTYKVRLKAGLSGGNYNQNVVLSGADAPSFNIACYGTVAVVSEFIITVKTDNTGVTANNQFRLPVYTGSGLTYNAVIDWGDSTTTNQTTDVAPTHTYAAPGTYQIKISGTFPSIRFNNGGDRLKLITINNWGTGAWSTFNSAFYGCANMQGAWADIPNTAAVTDMEFAFAGCLIFNWTMAGWNVSAVTSTVLMFYITNAFNQDLSSWNVSSLLTPIGMFERAAAFNGDITTWNTASFTDMSGMFRQSAFNRNISGWNVANVINMTTTFMQNTAFNQPIGTWNVIKVTQFVNTFYGATAFNQDISAWNVVAATSFSAMFFGATAFNTSINAWGAKVNGVTNISDMFQQSGYNQPLNSWDTSTITNFSGAFAGMSFNQNITGWNVSAGTNFGSMFLFNNAFNQAIGVWNMTSATNLSFMFDSATAFNQNIGAWNVVNVTSAAGIMANKTPANYSTANLDAIYNGWSLLVVKPNVTAGFGTIKYTAGGAAGRAILAGAPNNWTISDGGI